MNTFSFPLISKILFLIATFIFALIAFGANLSSTPKWEEIGFGLVALGLLFGE